MPLAISITGGHATYLTIVITANMNKAMMKDTFHLLLLDITTLCCSFYWMLAACLQNIICYAQLTRCFHRTY
jgi:hypothetical protein